MSCAYPQFKNFIISCNDKKESIDCYFDALSNWMP
jgi:hypothetical protein